MIYLSCDKCSVCLRISPGVDGEAESLFSEFSDILHINCWKCGGNLKLLHSVPADAAKTLDTVDVTPQEAYAAMYGLGLPTERDCTAAAVVQLLTGKCVARVSTSQIRGSHRCVINFIELEDGTRLFMGSSAYGATIYRVAPKHSYVEANDGS